MYLFTIYLFIMYFIEFYLYLTKPLAHATIIAISRFNSYCEAGKRNYHGNTERWTESEISTNKQQTPCARFYQEQR